MQNTRLNTLIEGTIEKSTQWVQNPWRRTSLIIISLLFGNFLASTITTNAGQQAGLDIVNSLVILVIVEFISWLRYGWNLRSRNISSEIVLTRSGSERELVDSRSIGSRLPLWVIMLDSLKLGLIYGFFLEAFKLGS
ncbi:MAG: DUF565 domain-containing protein [Chamaesiphon sp.]|nr:DUF565 domain-containing protein [Chamaesiphon sp.]